MKRGVVKPQLIILPILIVLIFGGIIYFVWFHIVPNTDNPKDCKSENGSSCEDYQVCDGEVLSVSDTNRCCAGQCKLPKKFDWRDRHGENWNSPVKSQAGAPICGMFSTIGALEAQINLYFNQHIDVDLSEQMYVDCLSEGEITELSKDPSECSWFSASSNMYCRWTYGGGVVEEECDPFVQRPEASLGNSNCKYGYVCNDWQNKAWKISDFREYNFREGVEIPEPQKERVFIGLNEDQFKQKLITEGPLGMVSVDLLGAHSVVLEGYETNSVDDSTVWIFKNSWGESYEDNGYFKRKVSFNTLRGVIPLGPIPPPRRNYSILCVDKDNDTYCNWGITKSKPPTCPSSCKPEKDWDDSDSKIGALGIY